MAIHCFQVLKFDNIFWCPAGCSDEDAELPENKRQRYVSLALGATSLILTSLDKTQAENIAAKIEGVLRDPRFWKYGKDKADAVWNISC